MHDNLHDKIHLEWYIIYDYYVARRSMAVIIHLYGISVMHKVQEMTQESINSTLLENLWGHEIL